MPLVCNKSAAFLYLQSTQQKIKKTKSSVFLLLNEFSSMINDHQRLRTNLADAF